MDKTLCVDFDGVLHSYSSGWQGATVIPDPPTDGAIAWLIRATYFFKVCIFSSRSRYVGAIGAMRQWLLGNGLPDYILERIDFPLEKPPAHVILDDRAICFTGEFPSMEEIAAFTPWNRKGV